MTLGDIIAEYRKTHGLSMAKFAERSGISKGYISMLERNKTHRGEEPSPSVDVYRLVAAAIGVDVDDLVRMVDGKITISDMSALRTSFSIPNIQPIPETYRVPRLGTIACGLPILAEQNIETFDSVPTSIRCDFTLICKGDSMTGAGIEDGDIVYIREQPEVETGEIAAVMVGEEEATLKRFKRVGDTVLLIPENNSYEPLVFADGEMEGVRILGKAVGFTRHFRE